MALDGIYTHHLVNELQEKLHKARLESTYNNGLYFVFTFYKEKNRYHLTFNLNAAFSGCYLSKSPVQKMEPTNFSSNLKRHLDGSILESISQYLTDRVMIFTFTQYDFIQGPITKKVVFEAMGKHANLYILNQDDIIIDAYKKMFVVEGRHLVPQAKFEFFKTEKISSSLYEFNPLLSPKEITDKYLGISLRLAKYLSENPVKPFDIKVRPTLSIKDNKTYFFNIFESETISFNSLSEALDSRIMDIKDQKVPFKNFITQYLKKLIKKQELLIIQKNDALNNLEDKQKGDYIYENATDLELHLKSLGPIKLNEEISLSKNAQKFYKNYQKSKRAINHIENEIELNQDMINIFESYLIELEITQNNELNDFKEILTPYGFMKQRKAVSTKNIKSKIKLLTIKDENAIYIIGKNAHQNAHLMNTLGLKSDFWFHVQNATGSHVLVKCESLNEQIIRKAAMLSAYFSSLKDSSSIPVNYTSFKYVSKISGKPASFVKIKNEKTIFIDIDEDKIKSWLYNA